MATAHHHLWSAHQMQSSAMGCAGNAKLPCLPSLGLVTAMNARTNGGHETCTACNSQYEVTWNSSKWKDEHSWLSTLAGAILRCLWTGSRKSI